MSTKEIFEAAGLTYEYPGFYSATLPDDTDFTVGINGEGCDENPPADSVFSVQVMSQDGECTAAEDIVGADNVVVALKVCTSFMKVIISSELSTLMQRKPL